MILRKPYAFFIRHFKLIHIILAVFAFYSIYKTKLLLDFFNEYSASIMDVTGQDLVSPLLPGLFQLVPLLIIIFSIVVLFVMAFKKKPYFFYIVTIAIYIFTFIMLQVSKGTLNTLYVTMLDVRSIRLIRDLIMVTFIAQLISSIFIVVRATGFDVKKFDFKSDLKEIEINEEDREEVEVQLNFDTNKGIRGLRRKIRYLKYSYKENKLLFNLVFAIAGVSLICFVGVLIFNREKIINQNVYFSGNNFTVNLTNSYLVNTNYKGKIIDEDYYYLVLKLQIKNNTNREFGLDIATTKILIDNYVYTPISENKSSFFDFGRVYQSENIGSELEEKVLVYKIPKQLIKEDIIFSFVDKNTVDKDGKFATTKVRINYEDLTGIASSRETNINDTLSFEDSILSDYKIHITSFDINNKYKLEYNFCVSGECYKSYEYVKPSLASNYNKVLLRIKGTLESEKKLDNIYDLYDFIEAFGSLYYELDGQKKVHAIQFKEVKSKRTNENDIYYIEVLEEVKDATKISLVFTIRNKNYEYILK